MTSPPARIRPGLVSITFRRLTPERIVTLCTQSGLKAIEWGGDIHVPHGNTSAAQRARKLCEDTGIECYAYGSYYRAASGEAPEFAAVLDSALALGVPTIRVWAGKTGSAQAGEDLRKRIADDLRCICQQASRHGLIIALEYHGGTLTDTLSSTLDLLKQVKSDNLRSYWQPRHGTAVEQGLEELQALLPRLGDIHVFHWWPTPNTRLPLADGADRWEQYLRLVAADPCPRVAALEFVRDDDESRLPAEARTLHEILGRIQ